MPAAVLPPSSTDAYRRQARRLRCRYAGQPARLQRSLKALADDPVTRDPHGRAAHDAGRGAPTAAPFPPPQGSPAQRFADHLAQNVSGPVVRYSQRLQLIRAAGRLGIERFEANLLIAAVVERQRRGAGLMPANPASREGALLSGIAVFVLVQGAVALGAWWTVFH